MPPSVHLLVAVMLSAGASLRSGFFISLCVFEGGGAVCEEEGGGMGQHHSSNKPELPSALHTGTNTPLNQGLHILL